MRGTQPLVSIGLPMYNGGKYLSASIDSLLAQTYRNIELIISDNASDDGSSEACLRYARADPRVRYSRLDRNIGGVNNHNRVFELAGGEFFMWASSDDYWDPVYVQRCVEQHQSDPGLVLVYSINATMDESGRRTGQYAPGYKLDTEDVVDRFRQLTQTDNPIEPFYGLIRSRALKAVPKMCLHPGFDRFMLAELGLMGRFRQIPHPLYTRRIHSNQSVRAFPSLRERYRWVNPESKDRRFVWPFVEYACRFAGLALRTAPGGAAKIGCMWHMLKWCNWYKDELWKDICGAR